jgi:hypothetical protein
MTGGRRVGRLGVGSFAFAWAIGVPGHAPAHPMDAFAFLDRAAELGPRSRSSATTFRCRAGRPASWSAWERTPTSWA